MDPTRPSDETRKAEADDARTPAEPDEMPTPEEEAAAERTEPLDSAAAEHYKEMAERGAEQKGEGRLR